MKEIIEKAINDSGYKVINREKFDRICECLEKFRKMEDYFIFESLTVHFNGTDEIELDIKYPSWVIFDQGNENEFYKILDASDNMNIMPGDNCGSFLMKYTIANLVERM